MKNGFKFDYNNDAGKAGARNDGKQTQKSYIYVGIQ